MVKNQVLTKDVVVGKNVSLNCTSSAYVVWEIVGNDEKLLRIYLSEGVEEARERGFVLENPKPYVLQVLGSVENNQTEIRCKPSGGGDNIIISYKLNVIGNGNNYSLVLLSVTKQCPTHPGPPEMPGDVRGWVEEFSPVRLRLEWQESFSHHDHPVLYYTLYTRDGALVNTTDTSVTFNREDVEFSSNCTRNKKGIRVAAVNDIGESKPSPVVSMQRGWCSFLSIYGISGRDIIDIPADVTDKQFEVVDGKLFSQNELSMFELQIKVNRASVYNNPYLEIPRT